MTGGKSARRRPRSRASLTRTPGRRSRECILIVCEGRETEPNYFEALRRELKLGTVEVQVEGGGGAPASVVRRAVSAIEQRRRDAQRAERAGAFSPPEFDQVWCVFDTENRRDNPSFEAAVKRGREGGFQLAVSNPAFEYWVLLHFEETSRPFRDAEEIIGVLRKHVPDYQKNKDIFRRVCRFTPQAIQRAEQVMANHDPGGDTFPNPSTLVHRLVGRMIGMANFMPCQ